MWHCFDSTIMSSDVALTRRSWRIRAGLIYPWHIPFKPARASRLSFLCVELDISNILVGRFIGCCAWLNGALDSFPLAQRAEVLWILWSDLQSSSHRLLIHDGLRRDLQTDARVFSREKDRRKWDRWGKKLWGELVRSRSARTDEHHCGGEGLPGSSKSLCAQTFWSFWTWEMLDTSMCSQFVTILNSQLFLSGF